MGKRDKFITSKIYITRLIDEAQEMEVIDDRQKEEAGSRSCLLQWHGKCRCRSGQSQSGLLRKLNILCLELPRAILQYIFPLG